MFLSGMRFKNFDDCDTGLIYKKRRDRHWSIGKICQESASRIIIANPLLITASHFPEFWPYHKSHTIKDSRWPRFRIEGTMHRQWMIVKIDSSQNSTFKPQTIHVNGAFQWLYALCLKRDQLACPWKGCCPWSCHGSETGTDDRP